MVQGYYKVEAFGVRQGGVTWLRVYGIPCHVWNANFSQLITKHVGTFLCVDGDTRLQVKMGVTRLLVNELHQCIE